MLDDLSRVDVPDAWELMRGGGALTAGKDTQEQHW